MFYPVYGQSQNDTLSYKVDLNFSGRKIAGTFSQEVVGGGIHLSIVHNNWQFENNTTYRYNRTNTRLIEDNWYDLVVIKYYPGGKKKFCLGAFYHFDNNLMFSVNSRHQYGIGLGSDLIMGNIKLSHLAAIANEDSTFNGFKFVNSVRDFSNRKNGLFLFRLNHGYSNPRSKINFSYELFYFQSLKESADFDIWFSPRIRFKVFDGLSFHIVYDYRFENVHLESLSNFNDIILFGFNLKLSGA